jgi:broad specificity phosphatase PhoE
VHKVLKLNHLNPHLSNLGLLQIKQAKKAYHGDNKRNNVKRFLKEKVDMVCCSDMVRAMETAYNLFPKQEINVIPYVNEKGRSQLFVKLNWDLENHTQGPIDSVRRLKAMGYDPSHYEYGLYLDITQGRLPFPNRKKFFQKVVLDRWLNPESPFYVLPPHHTKKSRRPFRIAIVSHGHFLRDLVSQASRAPKSFWSSTPYFRPVHCRNEHYTPDGPAVGNVGMFLMKLTEHDIEDYVRHRHRLPAPYNIFETNAIYNPDTKQCMEYDGKRFILPEYGQKSHVERCPANIRNMKALKS